MSSGPPGGGEPWTRVRDVLPIPDPVTVAALLRFPDEVFAETVRGNLLPRSDSKSDRAGWSGLWWTLGSDPALAERAFDLLSRFLTVTEAALDAGALDEAAARRARKFRGVCLEAWSRLVRDEGKQPLAWAGPGAQDLNPVARKTVALLVSAIASHRSTTRRADTTEDHDRRLWAVLARVGLDPAAPGTPGRPVDVDVHALAWAGPAAAALNPHGRAVAAVLVSAITAHRAATDPSAAASPDQWLWRILAVVDLDPDSYGAFDV